MNFRLKTVCPVCKAKRGHGCVTPGTTAPIKGTHEERYLKPAPKQFYIEGLMVEPSLESPPYGCEVKGATLKVIMADDWNSIELLICRYQKKKGYHTFGFAVVMNGSENSNMPDVVAFLESAKVFVGQLKSVSCHKGVNRPELLSALKAAFKLR